MSRAIILSLSKHCRRGGGFRAVKSDEDFLALHNTSPEHAGIAYAPQQTSIGEMVRGLLLIHDVLTPEEMRGRVEYI